MTVKELKEKIEANEIPNRLVLVDNNHTLCMDYLNAISKVWNKQKISCYSEEDIMGVRRRFDNRDLLPVVKFDKFTDSMKSDMQMIFVLDEPPKQLPLYDTVEFPKLTKNQIILYLTNLLIERKFRENEGTADNPKWVPTLSVENMAKWCDYFENDIDMIMGEVEKLLCLENHQLNTSFTVLFDCLPDKQKRLRSLPWYNGGAVDTATVLYRTYAKKLAAAGELNTPIHQQKFYAMLMREALFVEQGILNDTFGDYALDYFRLIEQMKPDDCKIQYHPPVATEDIGPEWKRK